VMVKLVLVMQLRDLYPGVSGHERGVEGQLKVVDRLWMLPRADEGLS
jgi:hypothetical protein